MKMMWLILQHDKADDWVISTGKTTKIEEFLIKNHACRNWVRIFWKRWKWNSNCKKLIKSKYKLPVGKEVVSINPNYYRPTEVDLLIGDSSKAKKELGWEPSISLDELISEMMDNDLSLIKNK